MNHQVPLVAQLPGPEREAASGVRMQAPDADMPIGSGLEDARETAGSDTQNVADESQPSEQVLLVEVDPCRPRLSRCSGCSCSGPSSARGGDRWQFQVADVRVTIALQDARDGHEVVAEQPALDQLEEDAEASDAAVAVHVGVNGLELDVAHGHSDEQRHVVSVDPAFPVRQQVLHGVGWRRDERGFGDAALVGTDPVLSGPDRPGQHAVAAHAVEQTSVGLVKQPHAHREGFEVGDGLLGCAHVVQHLPCVTSRLVARDLGSQELAEARVCSLQRRRRHCFPSQQCRDEQDGIRKLSGGPVQSRDVPVRCGHGSPGLRGELDVGRKLIRDEGLVRIGLLVPMSDARDGYELPELRPQHLDFRKLDRSSSRCQGKK